MCGLLLLTECVPFHCHIWISQQPRVGRDHPHFTDEETEAERVHELISSIPVVLRGLVPDLRSPDSGDHTSRQYMIDSGDTGWGQIYPKSPPSPVTEVDRSIQRSAGDLSLGGTNNTEKLRLISPSWPRSQQTLVMFRMDQT